MKLFYNVIYDFTTCVGGSITEFCVKEFVKQSFIWSRIEIFTRLITTRSRSGLLGVGVPLRGRSVY